MSSASAILDLRIITTGSRAGQWGDDTNENMRILDRMAGGAHQLAVTGSATTLVASAYTLGSWHGLVQRVQGSITGTHTLTVPDAERLWVIADETSGAGVLQVGVGSGSTMMLPKAAKALAYVRGSNGIEPILVIGSGGASVVEQTTVGSARTVLGAGSNGSLLFQTESAGSARTLLNVVGPGDNPTFGSVTTTNNVAAGSGFSVTTGTATFGGAVSIDGSAGLIFTGDTDTGLFKTTVPAGYSSQTNAVKFSVDALGMRLYASAGGGLFFTSDDAATTTSTGRTAGLRGGPGGSTSGAGGAATMNGGVPIDGNGGSVTVAASAGVGTNRSGGAATLQSGSSTGTGTAGTVTIIGGQAVASSGAAGAVAISSGAATASGAFAGNLSITGGAASSGALTGAVTITGSASVNTTTGPVTIRSGSASVSGNAGAVSVIGGDTPGGAGGTGGGVIIRGGTGTANGGVTIGTGGTDYWFGCSPSNGNAMMPAADNTVAFGDASFRPTVIYAVSGTINTSDVRTKTDIAPLDLGLDFVASIQPISYRLIEGHRRLVAPQVNDEAGAMVTPPVYEAVPGTRTHFGFSAQDIRAALGSDAYAVWSLADPADPDSRQGLRPDQITPILWNAVRELSATVESLRARVAQLEGASP